jgi:hypothetical protein
MLECMKEQWPDFLYLENGGIKNYWFQRQIKELNRNKFVNMIGSGSSGKTFSFSCYAYTFWKIRPMNTSVFISTTTGEAAEMRAWGTIKELYEKDRYGKRIKFGVQIDYRKMIVLQGDPNDKSDRDYRDSMSVISIRQGQEGRNAIAAICGRKNQHVIWGCDEEAFMDAGIRSGRGALYSNPFWQFGGLGNEPYEGDPLYLDCEPAGPGFEQGWDTPGLVDMESWPTMRGICLYFDGEKSPNMEAPKGQPPPFPKLATRQFIEDTIREDGGIPDGPLFWRWVKGFPKRGVKQDTVLTTAVLQEFRATEDPIWLDKNWKTVAGLDLGFRQDGDPCVADFARLGWGIEGQQILAHEPDTVKLVPRLSDPGTFEQKIARAFLDECQKRACHDVAIDYSGDGGILAKEIIEEAHRRGYDLHVFPVSFLGAPDENARFTIAGKSQWAVDIFDRKVSQLWYSYRLAVQDGLIRGCQLRSRAVAQLTMRKCRQDERRRWSVQSKKEMKKTLKRSPDDGDSRVLCHECARLIGLQKRAVKSPEISLQEAKDLTKPSRYSSGHSRRRAYTSRLS